MATVQDSVCGMMIEHTTASAQSKYDGAMYYFCSASCKARFDDDPARYVGAPRTPVHTQAMGNGGYDPGPEKRGDWER